MSSNDVANVIVRMTTEYNEQVAVAEALITKKAEADKVVKEKEEVKDKEPTKKVGIDRLS